MDNVSRPPRRAEYLIYREVQTQEMQACRRMKASLSWTSKAGTVLEDQAALEQDQGYGWGKMGQNLSKLQAWPRMGLKPGDA